MYIDVLEASSRVCFFIMGRPINEKTITMHKMFVQYEKSIVTQKKIVQPKSDSWKYLREKLLNIDVAITEKAIYTAALKWWSNYETNEVETLDKSDDRLSDHLSETSEIDSVSICEEKRKIKFAVELSAKVWETIKPVEKIYLSKTEQRKNGVRSYKVLQPGVWSNVVLDHISKKRRDIPCAWVFETNKCYGEGEVFLKFQATCKMCFSSLIGILENKPEDNEPVKIDCEITSLDLTLHENVEPNVVKIGGKFAKELYGKTKSATGIRRSLLRKRASLFKRPYGRVPSSNAIRCAQYRRRQKEKLSSCPLQALAYLKASTKYMNTIHFIGNDPFSCIYSSPDQMKLYKAYRKKNRFTKVSCDFTGGVANRLDRPGDEKSGQILFCTMVISDGFQAPVHQMLSEKNQTNWIHFFFNVWVEITSEIPNQFASDMSMALLNGAVKAFTSCGGVAEYIEVMFDLLQGNTFNRPIPQCFVRIDIAHLMKNVTSCEALHNKPKKVRDFFIRCVAWLLTVDNIDDAKEHILSVLVVATSSSEGNSTSLGGSVPCETHKTTLIRKITGNCHVEEAEQTAYLVEKSVLEDTFDQTIRDTNVSAWLGTISNEAVVAVSSLDDGDRDNLMFNKEFVLYFTDLLRLLPLWSAICCQFFPGSEPIASSGNVESHIKVVKQSMEEIIPCSVDKFVQQNMDVTQGIIIEASQDYIRFISNEEQMEFNFSSERTLEAEVEEVPRTKEADTVLVQDDERMSTVVIGESFNEDQDNSTNSNLSGGDIEKDQTISGIDVGSCPVCRDKNWPSGAHKCIVCGKNVHIIPGCSVSIGGAEGYGEKRVCVSCDVKRQKGNENKVSEMHHAEKWSRTSKRQHKQSKYRMAVPNWNLNHQFDKNVKIGFLTNGNMSLRVFGTKNNLFGLKNTCSFDVLAQILAATYAYIPSCRNYMDYHTHEGIFEIAVALAKNENMNRVNNMRARLLSKFEGKQDMAKMMKLMLKNIPSCIFNWECETCQHPDSINEHYLRVDVRSDMSKLNDVITNHVKRVSSSKRFCSFCETEMAFVDFKVSDHLFIILRIEISLAEIPEVIRVGEDCTLFGAILFIYPLIEGDEGHYVAAIKLNATWNVFDDKKSKPYFVAAKKTCHVHSILYTKASQDPVTTSRNGGATNSTKVSGKENIDRPTKKTRRNVDSVQETDTHLTKNPMQPPAYVEPSLERMRFLKNGCSYKVGNSRVFLKNTCAFDSIAHVLAAAFTLCDAYKKKFETSEDDIFRIASSLSINDTKKKVDDMRSNLLLRLFGQNNVAFVINKVLSEALKQTPSVRETLKCSRECCMSESVTIRPYLTMNMFAFDNNMENIERGINANLNFWTKCRICETDLRLTREFGHHLFIEIPVSSLVRNSRMVEHLATFKLRQLNFLINIDEKRYSLFGVILFQPSVGLDGLGHYVTAINVNRRFFVIDDLRQSQYLLEEEEDVVVHCLFYIENELLNSTENVDSDDCSFEFTTDHHSYESFYRLYHNIQGNVSHPTIRL